MCQDHYFLLGQILTDVKLTPDNTTIISSDVAGQIKAWDINSGDCLQTIIEDTTVEALALSPDGRFIFAGLGYGNYVIKVWDWQKADWIILLRGMKIKFVWWK